MTPVLGRPCARKADLSPWDAAFWALMVAAAVVVLLLFRDYGYNWDEVWGGQWYGRAIYRYFATFGADRAAAERGMYNLYGWGFDLPAEMLARFGPFSARNARHFAVAVCGLLALWGTGKTARYTGGPAAGFGAAFLLLSNGLWFGHIFHNYKDVPFAAAFIWALYALLRATTGEEAFTRRRVWLFALALGALWAVRPGGIFFVAIVFAALGIEAATSEKGSGARIMLARFGRNALAFLPVFASAWLVMVALWPYALENPLTAPLEAMAFSGKVGFSFPVFWNGAFYKPDALPWTYVPLLALVKLPEPTLILTVLGVCWSAWKLGRAIATGDRDQSVIHVTLFLGALLAPVLAIISGATLYDNLRHFLFALSPLAALAAHFSVATARRLKDRYPRAPVILAIALVLALLPSMVLTARLHPYEYTYLNIFAGGMPEGEARFETDYWALSYREAAALIVDDAKTIALAQGVAPETRPFTVAVVGPYMNLKEELTGNFSVVRVKESEELEPYADRVDYYLATTRYAADKKGRGWQEVGRVSRLGMTFAVVKASPHSVAGRVRR